MQGKNKIKSLQLLENSCDTAFFPKNWEIKSELGNSPYESHATYMYLYIKMKTIRCLELVLKEGRMKDVPRGSAGLKSLCLKHNQRDYRETG